VFGQINETKRVVIRIAARAIVGLVDRLPSSIAGAMRGDSTLARITRPVINRVVPEGETVVTIRSGRAKGLRMPIFPRSEKYYWTGAYEPHVQDALANVLEPGMHFWDVGAHVGFFTLIAARIVGTSGHVVSFEPMPGSRTRLKRAITLNHFTNVEVSAFALTNSDGARKLRPPREAGPQRAGVTAQESSPMWTLVAGEEAAFGVQVETRRVDVVLRSAVTPPDVMKIDVEGAEIDVLAGGTDLFNASRPALIVEMSNEEVLERCRSLLRQYHFDHLGKNHWLLT
jgi:FkbM family methyltransferase